MRAKLAKSQVMKLRCVCLPGRYFIDNFGQASGLVPIAKVIADKRKTRQLWPVMKLTVQYILIQFILCLGPISLEQYCENTCHLL